MADDSDNLPVRRSSGEAVLVEVQQFLAGFDDDVSPASLADALGGDDADDLLVLMAQFIAHTEKRGPTYRLGVGLTLTRKRDRFARGEWTPWLQAFGKRSGVPMRSISRWMMEAQKSLGLAPPKGAQPAAPSRVPKLRQVARISPEPIEATAVEVPPPAAPNGKPPAPTPGEEPMAKLVKGPPALKPQAKPEPASVPDVVVEAVLVLSAAKPPVLAVVARTHRAKLKAVNKAIVAALAFTAAEQTADRPAVNAVKTSAAAGPHPQTPAEAAQSGRCAHVDVNRLPYGNFCRDCGARL